ncbi:MAG TPA: HK97 family phage prohead protease [Terracidiphilus sp.]|nr:HK97 family phage prohead protease [Terracidiphilus sp.]
MERRFIKGGQVRAKTGDKPGISGVAAVYGPEYDLGYFSEKIAPGAFTRALEEKQDVRCLFNHNPDNLLGRTKNRTLSLADSSDGLQYDCDTDPETSVGRDVVRMIERGDLDGCSFAFVVRKDNWSDEFDGAGRYVRTVRTIEDLDLYDVGPVTYPAYTETSVGIRSMWPEGLPAEVRSHLPAEKLAELEQLAARPAAARASSETTKKVDGEDLTKDCFLLVGDPDKTATWALPWKFSTAEKTKEHLRDALARFNQVEGFSDELLAKAWKKLLMLCDHYGIDVAEKEQPRSARTISMAGDGDGMCECPCDPCNNDGDCENCSHEDCDCQGCMCPNAQGRSLRLRARAHIIAGA